MKNDKTPYWEHRMMRDSVVRAYSCIIKAHLELVEYPGSDVSDLIQRLRYCLEALEWRLLDHQREMAASELREQKALEALEKAEKL